MFAALGKKLSNYLKYISNTTTYLALRGIKREIEDLSDNLSGVGGSREGGVANADLVQ